MWICVLVIRCTPLLTKPITTNTIETLSPIQGGIVKNYIKFYLIKTIITYNLIKKYNKLPIAKFLKQNPDVGKNYQYLLIEFQVYVIIDNYKPILLLIFLSNRIKTVLLIQDSIYKNYNKFYKVYKIIIYYLINNYYKLTLKELYFQNPSIGTNY